MGLREQLPKRENMTRHDMPEEEILILLQEGSGVGSGVSSVLALDVIAATRMKFCVECLE